MKKLYFIAVAVAWFTGMFFLVKREYFDEGIIPTATGYQQILPQIKHKKQMRLAIYYGLFQQEKIGEAQYIITPRLDEIGKPMYEIDAAVKLKFAYKDNAALKQLRQLMNLPEMKMRDGKFKVSYITISHVDYNFQLRDIKCRFISEFMNFSYEGKVKDDKLFITFFDEEGKRFVDEKVLPMNTMTTNGMGLIGKFPDLKMGKSYKMRWFDPLNRSYKVATAKVVEENAQYVWAKEEKPVHAYRLVTSYGLFESHSWVTADGDVMQYTIPGFRFMRIPIPKIENSKKQIKNEKDSKKEKPENPPKKDPEKK